MSDAADLAGLSALKLALMAKEARQRSGALLRADPIAIVGMACRVPGADSPAQLWDLLCEGRDAVREIPADRWDADAWADADLAAPGKIITRRAACLDRIDGFDAEYFGILPREAERMDPQQRLFMEVAMEALDDAGLTRGELSGSRTGVYVASYHNDYTHQQYADVAAIDARTLTGTLHSVLANRLSYFLDLRGPSLSVDTACSSSLVAIHLACQGLRSGESDLALAGGVSLIVAPELMVAMSKVGFMSPDGRCKTFDALADGFGRGEGCGLLVLKRLSDAIAHGDRVLAVIRGSAVNQDGHSTLLAAPHGPAQEALMREALSNAGLDAGRIGFIETHGTGTALGDPIEVEAIANVVGRAASAAPCFLGSAKANVGHLEAAAGVIGAIKAALALRHGRIPPQPNFRALNPHISLEGTRLRVASGLETWGATPAPRCASVSSFGVGGTNAHVILEEAPRLPAEPVDEEGWQLLALSAHTPAALADVARRWAVFLAQTSTSLSDICFTANGRRTHLEARVALVGRSRADLAAKLDAFVASDAPTGVAVGRCLPHRAAKLAFVFSGQGPQWFGMGRELLGSEPAFRSAIERCDALLRPLAGWSLLDELGRDESQSRLARTEFAQPALFALQVALAKYWQSLGVVPDAVVGHSLGEIAALCVAGVLDLPTAVRLVWLRGRIMDRVTGQGRMASVGLSEAEALARLQPFGEQLSLAAVNAHRSVVLSGDGPALESLLEALAREGIAQRLLPVDYAFHSAQMTPLRRGLVAELGRLAVHPARVPVYSTVLGERVDEETIDAEYFGRNLREPVRFAAAVTALADDGVDAFLEIGPHPVLGSAIVEGLATREVPPVVAASLRRARSERESILQAAATLHASGVPLRWDAIVPAPGNVVELPAYPWQHRRFWIRPRASAPSAQRSGQALLGEPLQLAGSALTVRSGDACTAPWLADHRIGGRLLLPAAAMMEAMLAAATAPGRGAVELLDFALQRPVVLHEAPSPQGVWQLQTLSSSADRRDHVWYARGAAPDAAPAWQQVATAHTVAGIPRRVEPPGAPSLPWVAVDAAAFYTRMQSLGVDFGPAFRRLADIEQAPGRATAALSACEPDAGLRLHPTLIDAAMQLCSIAAAPHGQVTQVWLPLGADRIWFDPHAGVAQGAEAIVRPDGGVGLCADAVLRDASGSVVLHIANLRFAAASGLNGQQGTALPSTLPLYEVQWVAVEADEDSSATSGPWLLLADQTGFAARLGEALAQRGAPVTQATAAQVGDSVGDASMLKAVVGRAAATMHAGPLHVVHCWSLDMPTGAADRADGAGSLLPASLLHLVQACAAAGTRRVELTIVTRGAQSVCADEDPASLAPRAAAAWGLAGTIALEHPDLQLRIVDLDPRPGADDTEAVALLLALRRADEPLRRALRRGRRWQPRLVDAGAPGAAHAVGGLARGERLEVVRAGALDGVAVRPVSPRPIAADEVRLHVVAAGLNFRDVLHALGMYPGDAPLGAECAGEVLEVGAAVRSLDVGDRVFGLAPGALAADVVVPAAFVARMPIGLGFDAAAGLPVAFLTAHHGLFALAGLQPKQRVLVHAGAGGVGMAAVQLALRRGATVYATAGTETKRTLLLRSGVTAVFDSRSTAFADELLAATGGEGVDVVLNSLAGEFIPASLRLLVRGGTFLELGKRDDWTAQSAAAAYPGVRHCRYDFATEAARRPERLAPMYDELLAGIADGSLEPLPTTSFAIAEVQDAMRHMAQALHVGKIVLRISHPSSRSGPTVRADGSYWITGGLGAIGLATARWLAAEGAGHLVLSGRHAPDANAGAVIASLQQAGARVTVLPLDVGDPAQVRDAIATIRRDALPLRGVFHAAGSLHDGVLATQRWDEASVVLSGKADGAWNLHAATSGLDLDCFVLYSAAGVWLGAPGQGLYGAANAALDALAHYRRRLGLPALSVAWGLWSDGGMASRAVAGRDAWAGRGLLPLDAATGMACLERLLRAGAAHALALPMDWARFHAQQPEGADRSVFARLEQVAASPAAAMAVTPAPRRSIVDELRALVPAQRRVRLSDYLAQQTLAVLGLDAATVLDPRAALKDAGLDSLMAVELRNLLTRVSPEPLPATLLFDYPTLVALTDCLMKAWQLDGGAAAPRSRAAERAPDMQPVDIDAMSEAEAEAALLAELDRDKLAPAP